MFADGEKLAIHGGSPAVTLPLAEWPPPDETVQQALLASFAQGDWGKYHGPRNQDLAQKLSAMHQLEYVQLCCSGTIAVELALRGVEVTAEDEVILAAYDFPGNFRAIEAIGATPVLVDIDPATWSLDASALTQAISPRTKAILVSHLHGGIAPMSAIRSIADAAEIAVVEDACQVPGAIVEGRPAGAWGDAGVLSFGGSKLLTAGRGGAMMTSRIDVHQRAKIFSERGNQAFPLSELQAAVVLPQLGRLEQRNARRNEGVKELLKRLGQTPCLSRAGGESSEPNGSHNQSVYYKLPWYLEEERLQNVTREDFVSAAVAEGIPLGEGFRGFTRRSPNRCRKAGDLSHSERAAQQTVLLHHTALLSSTNVVHQIADALNKVCDRLASTPC